MNPELKKLSEVLKSGGQSLTKPRKLVFEVLSSHEPQTMNELINILSGSVDRASVYRTVGLFESLGITQRLALGWKYKIELSDAFTHHHHHFSCMKCGLVITLQDDSQLEAGILLLAKSQGLTMTDHQLEIRGLCQDCASST
jgi:Fe2+ or Zn2+ uptake regulation protein